MGVYLIAHGIEGTNCLWVKANIATRFFFSKVVALFFITNYLHPKIGHTMHTFKSPKRRARVEVLNPNNLQCQWWWVCLLKFFCGVGRGVNV